MITLKQVHNILYQNRPPINIKLSNICTSPNINKWSFYKPVNSNKVTKLTDDEIYAVNDGFQLDNIHCTTIDEVIEKYPYAWKYMPISAPYRLSDFEGYEHNALPFINPQIMTTTHNTNNTIKIEMDGNKSVQWLCNFQAYPSYLNAEFGYIIFNNNTKIYYKQCAMLDVDIYTIQCSRIGEGAYNILPVISLITPYPNHSVHSGKEFTGDFYILPCEPLEVEITNTVTPPSTENYITIDFVEMDSEVVGYNVTINSVTLKLYNSSDKDITLSYTLSFTDALTPHSISGTITVPSNSNITHTITPRDTIRYESINGEITMQMEYTYNGSTYIWSYKE